MNILRLAIALFVIGLAASVFGLKPLAGLADDGAEALIFVAVVMFLLTFLYPKPPTPLSPA